MIFFFLGMYSFGENNLFLCLKCHKNSLGIFFSLNFLNELPIFILSQKNSMGIFVLYFLDELENFILSKKNLLQIFFPSGDHLICYFLTCLSLSNINSFKIIVPFLDLNSWPTTSYRRV